MADRSLSLLLSVSPFVRERTRRLRALAWLCIRSYGVQELFLVAEFIRSRRLIALYETIEVPVVMFTCLTVAMCRVLMTHFG